MTFSKEVVDMMRLASLLFISMVVAIPGLLVLRFADSPMPIHVAMLATAADRGATAMTREGEIDLADLRR
jgi:hypothetical protein